MVSTSCYARSCDSCPLHVPPSHADEPVAVHDPVQPAVHLVAQVAVVGTATHCVVQWSSQHAPQDAWQHTPLRSLPERTNQGTVRRRRGSRLLPIWLASGGSGRSRRGRERRTLLVEAACQPVHGGRRPARGACGAVTGETPALAEYFLAEVRRRARRGILPCGWQSANRPGTGEHLSRRGAGAILALAF